MDCFGPLVDMGPGSHHSSDRLNVTIAAVQHKVATEDGLRGFGTVTAIVQSPTEIPMVAGERRARQKSRPRDRPSFPQAPGQVLQFADHLFRNPFSSEDCVPRTPAFCRPQW
jgi:hypothetical protein